MIKRDPPRSFGVQITFEHIKEVLEDSTCDAIIKALYVELLQGWTLLWYQNTILTFVSRVSLLRHAVIHVFTTNIFSCTPTAPSSA